MTTSSGGGANSQAILEECREVGRALDLLDDQLSNLERVFRQVLARPDMPSDEINSTRSQVMTGYCALVNHVKNIKLKPESGSPKNAPQIGKEDRRLKAAIQRYQTLESEFRRDLQQAAERQYRIVRPKATDAEVREAVADTEAPIFKRALLSLDYRGQASSTLRNVKERHEAIHDIAPQVVELAQLFEDLDQIVQQQEPLVADIEQKGEETCDSVTKGNEKIGIAVISAHARNRKKWWCLLIVILTLIVVAVVLGVVIKITRDQ